MNATRLIMLLGVVLGLFSVTARAQKVVTDGTGASIKVIIDAFDMPHTTAKKAQSTTATNNNNVQANVYTDIASATSNEKVYRKFEVSKVDVLKDGTDWLSAINNCKGLTHNGSSGWRLPTQRELILIWVLKTKLEQVNGFNKFTNGTYWSATEYEYVLFRSSWYVSLTDGNAAYLMKDQKVPFVRCVRDL